MRMRNNHTNPLAESRRHLANARQMLREKGGKKEGFYSDKKYVKLAGHSAWTGVLLAMDCLLKKKDIHFKGRRDADKYREYLGPQNRTILNYFNSCYENLHLFCGYDGALDAGVFQRGHELAEKIIHWVENQVNHKH